MVHFNLGFPRESRLPFLLNEIHRQLLKNYIFSCLNVNMLIYCQKIFILTQHLWSILLPVLKPIVCQDFKNLGESFGL